MSLISPVVALTHTTKISNVVTFPHVYLKCISSNRKKKHKSDMLSLSEINAVRLSQCICLGKDYIRQWTSGPPGNLMCGD